MGGTDTEKGSMERGEPKAQAFTETKRDVVVLRKRTCPKRCSMRKARRAGYIWSRGC